MHWCSSSAGHYRVLHLSDKGSLFLYRGVHKYDSSRSFSRILRGVNELVVLCNTTFTAVGAPRVVDGVEGVWAIVDVLIGGACGKSEENHRVRCGELREVREVETIDKSSHLGIERDDGLSLFFAHPFHADFKVGAFYSHFVTFYGIELMVDVINIVTIAVSREGTHGAGGEYCRVFIIQCGIGASVL